MDDDVIDVAVEKDCVDFFVSPKYAFALEPCENHIEKEEEEEEKRNVLFFCFV